jgi:hypothetical protein
VALDFYGQHQRWGQSTESLDSAPARARSFE